MSVNRLVILEDRNIKKEAETILTYEDLTTEIDGMWNINDTIETISESLRKCLSNTAGRHVIKDLQNQPYWHRTHTSERTDVKVQKVYRGKNITRTIYRNHRIGAILRTLDTLFQAYNCKCPA
jgi:hypothetical protein